MSSFLKPDWLAAWTPVGTNQPGRDRWDGLRVFPIEGGAWGAEGAGLAFMELGSSDEAGARAEADQRWPLGGGR